MVLINIFTTIDVANGLAALKNMIRKRGTPIICINNLPMVSFGLIMDQTYCELR